LVTGISDLNTPFIILTAKPEYLKINKNPKSINIEANNALFLILALSLLFIISPAK